MINDFLGFFPVGVGSRYPVGLVNLATGAPANPDSNPTYRIYGQSGFITGSDGTLTPFESGTITGATNANPIVITAVAHGLSTGTAVRISGVLGNTAANGLFVITRLTADTFSIAVAGSGAYTSGGSWKTAGLYLLDLSLATVPAVVGALEENLAYCVDVAWAESAVAKKASFQVVVG